MLENRIPHNMKKTFFLILLISLFLGCKQEQQASAIEVHTASANATSGTVYGQAFSVADAMDVAQLQNALQGNDSIQAVVASEIAASCQSKGCWMDVQFEDNSIMKVTFKDYGFFLPVQDLKGKSVVFTGTAKRIVTSVDEQRHYAEDAGKSKNEIDAITVSKEAVRFVADGVIIK